jgi:hypothetical protein
MLIGSGLQALATSGKFKPVALDQIPTAGNKMDQVLKIYTDLTDRPTLRELCTNPLVLSMYVAQDQEAGHPIGVQN